MISETSENEHFTRLFLLKVQKKSSTFAMFLREDGSEKA